jgi:hypothetical protein
MIGSIKGLYLYAIRSLGKKKVNKRGIDSAPIFFVPYKTIEAVVSEVDLKKYNSKEIAEKAKEDVPWIVEQAKIHEAVIESSMGNQKSEILDLQAVIPMVFGTIFKTEKNLEAVLEKDYNKFKNTLKNLENKQEWGFKVYVDEIALIKEIKKSNKSISSKLEAAKDLPAGIDYFEELSIESEVTNKMDDELEKHKAKFLKGLGNYSVRTFEGKILSKDLTNKDHKMFLNSSYLVEIKKIDKFKKIVEEFRDKHKEFIFDCTGPWPPYHFV